MYLRRAQAPVFCRTSRRQIAPTNLPARPDARLLPRGFSLEPDFGGYRHEAGQRVGAHLSHHAAPVRFHCDFTDAELLTDLFVEKTGYDQSHDFAFAAAER